MKNCISCTKAKKVNGSFEDCRCIGCPPWWRNCVDIIFERLNNENRLDEFFDGSLAEVCPFYTTGIRRTPDQARQYLKSVVKNEFVRVRL